MTVTRKCPTGKRQFHEEEEAKWALTRIQQQEAADPTTPVVPQRAYQCEHCHRWHLTSQRRAGRFIEPEPRSRRADWRQPARELPEPTVTDDRWTWRASA